VCGHGDVKPVLVTGVDLTRDFAMMSYSNDGENLTAEFKVSASGVPFPWGAWGKPGAVYTNCGPGPRRPPSGTQTVDPEHPIAQTADTEPPIAPGSNQGPPIAQTADPEPSTTQTMDLEPSASGHMDTDPEVYHQCIFVRYYTVRKRLGIPKIIKAGAGPHDLGPGSRDDQGPPLEAQCSSDSGSDTVPSPFDNNGDNDESSVTSIDSQESDIVIHNTAVVGSPSFCPFSPH